MRPLLVAATTAMIALSLSGCAADYQSWSTPPPMQIDPIGDYSAIIKHGELELFVSDAPRR